MTLPDPERLVSALLRGNPDITAVLGDRVYTVIPQRPQWPLVRLTRWGGAPPFSHPLVMDEARLQIEAWGDRKAQAQDVAQLVRATLADNIPWGNSTDGWLVAARFGVMRYQPDDLSFDPPKPRYVADVEVVVRAA